MSKTEIFVWEIFMDKGLGELFQGMGYEVSAIP